MKDHIFRAIGTLIMLALTALQSVAQSNYLRGNDRIPKLLATGATHEDEGQRGGQSQAPHCPVHYRQLRIRLGHTVRVFLTGNGGAAKGFFDRYWFMTLLRSGGGYFAAGGSIHARASSVC